MAAVLFVVLAGFLLVQQRAAIRSVLVEDPLPGAGATVRPEAVVARAISAARLITVELQTTVTAQSASSSWRGDVTAVVRAPVRMFFGTDLSGLGDNAVRADPLSGAIVVTVPSPRRLATEVLGAGEEMEVQTGWLRLRSVAGEYHLGRARTGLYDAARRMTIKAEDAAIIEGATREQVVKLVRAIAGERTLVEVRFAGSSGHAGAGGSDIGGFGGADGGGGGVSP